MSLFEVGQQWLAIKEIIGDDCDVDVGNLFNVMCTRGDNAYNRPFGVGGAKLTEAMVVEGYAELVGEASQESVLLSIDSVGELPNKTGGSTPNQYRRALFLPTTADRTTHIEVDVEVGDTIDIFELDFNEGNVLKGMCRKGSKEDTSVEYDRKKAVWFSLRSMFKGGLITHKEFWQMAKACNLSEEV